MGFHLVAAATLFLVAAATGAPEHHLLSDSYIDLINNKQSSWKAGRNFPKNTPLNYLKNLLGVPLSGLKDKKAFESIPRVEHPADIIDSLPENFDSRDKWSNCPSLKEIRDQGSCGGCWAFASVEVMTDRICIKSNGTKNTHISAENLISCCSECGDGCNGGITFYAFDYWQSDGIVSGGNYNSNDGCVPYTIPPCVHHSPGEDVNPDGNKLPCLDTLVDTPTCVETCEKSYSFAYEQDKTYGNYPEIISSSEEHIRAEIYQNGPVVASFTVRPDFYHYKSGVYVPIDKKELGGHAIKIIGWGVENGIKYWLVANSWNNHWGNKGFIKMQRGVNECGIEDFVVAGEPDLSNK